MAVAQISPIPSFTIFVNVNVDADHVSVAPAGELDMATAGLVQDEVAHLRRTGMEHVVVDLGRVSFMDGQGLSMLVVLRDDARRGGGRLTLLPGPPQVQRVFGLTRTRALFDWA